MEGPTPSSAIFYGAISVHMGAYLLLRIQPILMLSPIAAGAAVVIGLTTAFLGTLSHRVSADVKTSLAYASMTQLGLIFAEIGLGLSWLALLHIVGHALVRTLQFLRAPSMLHDYHRMHSAAYGHLGETGKHYNSFVPAPLQLWLYRMGLERGYLDPVIDRYVIAPTLKLASALAMFEPKRDPVPTVRNPAEQLVGESDA
jgi:NAD(P)H-quinone oxidoreductase subunit 5